MVRTSLPTDGTHEKKSSNTTGGIVMREKKFGACTIFFFVALSGVVINLTLTLTLTLTDDRTSHDDETLLLPKKNSGDDKRWARVQDAEDNDDADDRPWLILHVGPPKTATTTIQEGLASDTIARMLAREDNFYYVGQHHHGIKTIGVGTTDDTPEINDDGITVFPMKHIFYDGGSGSFEEVLKEHRKRNHNVIISSEHYTSQFPNRGDYWEELYDRTFLRQLPQAKPGGWNNDNDNNTDNGGNGGNDGDEPHFGFRVKIVVTYRHFFQWLPSYYYQSFKVMRNSYMPGKVEYIDKFLKGLMQYDPANNNTNIRTTSYKGGRTVGLAQGHRKVHGTLWAYLQWSSRPEFHDRIDVFDMHQQEVHVASNDTATSNKTEVKRGLLTNFICQSLPSATNTCRYLSKGGTHTDVHERSSYTTRFVPTHIDKHRIIQRARSLPGLSSNATALPKEVLRARIDGWFGGAASVGDRGDLFTCLSPESKRRLKVASWNFLLQLVLLVDAHSSARVREKGRGFSSSTFRSSTPTDRLVLSSRFHNRGRQEDYGDDGRVGDESWMIPIRAAHDESFDKYVSTSGALFCELDIEKVFNDTELVPFLFR